MSEQTRMSKYKDLRDNIDDDTYVPHEEDDADDDFLSFIPKSNHRESLEPKTYETLKYESNPFESLHEDHLNTTRTRTDTRLDILNQMKVDASSQDTICDYHTSELRRGHAVKGGSLMDKLAAMSPEEDVEAFRKYSEEISHREPVKTEPVVRSAPNYENKHAQKKAPLPEKQEDKKLTKIVNGVIALLVIAVIVFIIMTFLNI